MPDVFISYAREDQGFARKLHDALEERKRNTWIDWKNIPLTAKWLEEVYSGIESAHTFAFVISHDSLASQVCMQELGHAVQNNKRLAPIWHRDVDDELVPPELASHQYIEFRESDDFEEAFQRLVSALDMDLEWVRAHTRLLVRAKEWEGEGRDDSFLLRGKDLEAAEAMELREAEKEPRLTALQKEYILASRQAAAKLQRSLLDAAKLSQLGGIAFIVSSALFITNALVTIYMARNPGSPLSVFLNVRVVGPIALLAAPLNLFGLIAFYARWLRVMGIFGLIAFLITYCGSVLAAGVYWHLTFVLPTIVSFGNEMIQAFLVNQPGMYGLGLLLSFQILNLGWPLFGLAILRARLYPRSVIIPLIVVTLLYWMLSALFTFAMPNLTWGSPLWYVSTISNIVFNTAVAGLGVVLWRDKGRRL